MSDLTYMLTLRRLVAAWSDHIQGEAAKFADSRRDLLPSRITSTQLYGLVNIVRNAQRFGDIQQFIRHQREKAERAGRQDVADYWKEMEQVLNNLRNDAKELQRQAGSLPPTISPKPALDTLHRQLTEEFVQHVLAHGLYWSPLPRTY
jgi:hypothetical protein